MAKLNFNGKSNSEYLGIVKDLLSLSFGYQLNVPKGASVIRPDLWELDEKKSITEGVIAIVEIKSKRINHDEVKDWLNSIQKHIDQFKPKRLIVVYFFSLGGESQKTLQNGLSKLHTIPQILGPDWLEDSLRQFPEVMEKWNISEILSSHKMEPSDKYMEFLKPVITILQKSETYIVAYDSDMQLDAFFKEGIWQTKYEVSNQTLASVNHGDVFILKAVLIEGNKMYLSVGGIGIVTSFAFEDQTVQVDWERLRFEVDVPYDDFFTNSIAKVDKEYRNRIFGRAVGQVSDFPKQINNLIDRNKEIFQQALTMSNDTPDRSSYQKEFDTVLKDLRVNDKTGEKRAFYAGGHDWGGDNQLSRFLADGIWESGWDKYQDVVNGVNEGDILLIKATVRKKDKGFIKLRAIGVVLKNYKNGRKLDVNWFEFAHEIMQRKGAHLWDTIQIISEGFIDDILSAVLDEYADLPGIIEELQNGKKFILSDSVALQGKERARKHEQKQIRNAQLSNSGFNSDWAFEKKDLLNIENDVRAFALLLASRDAKPPLAIALFGRWGSGKSFFMKHLEKRIRELSTYQTFWDLSDPPTTNDIVTNPNAYCHGIAHIWFNAWSYLDANLWAGLAHSLFEKLNEYITDQSKGEIEKLKVQVRLTRRLQILHNDLENFKEKREHLEGLKSRLIEEKDKRIARYFAPKYEKKAKEFLNENGIPEGIIEEMSPKKLKEKIETSTHFIGYLKKNTRQIFIWVIPLMVGLFLTKQLLALWWNTAAPYLESVWAHISAIVIPLWISANNFYKSKKSVIDKIGTFMMELSTKANKDENELGELQEEIKEIDPVIAEIEESINEEYALKSDVTRLAIANFISSKSNQKEYIDRLGIVSIIRKDFETLSELFYPDEEENNTEEYQKQLDKDRQYINDQFDDHKKLERIILYIDDLDRCPDNKVLEVIQAVHLLMAFPLFNVVVGVDNRCIHNALNYQYMLRYDQFQSSDNFKDRIHEIAPEDYIEKIFQIPFKLHDPDPTDIEKFIDYLLSNQVEEPEDNVKVEEATNEENAVELTEEKKEELQKELDEEYKEENEAKRKEEVRELEKQEEAEIMEERREMERQMTKEIMNDNTNVIDAATDLKFSPEEMGAIKAMSLLVGNVPRTIKRYINIYRIIRSHEQLEYEEGRKLDHFKGILFMLALAIGDKKEIAERYFDLIEKDPSKNIKKYNDEFEELRYFTEYSKNRKELGSLLEIKGEVLERHSPFVKRFSFAREKTELEVSITTQEKTK